jgi:hypothetical protein
MTQLETYRVAAENEQTCNSPQAHGQPSEYGILNLDDTNLKANPKRIGLILNQRWSTSLTMRI